ncbi:MAG: hypothetical protein FWH24_05670, partial [Oscillospiraceae bacterium]|nr:hypothetical protein [Oscillospiraceae bacterium]
EFDFEYLYYVSLPPPSENGSLDLEISETQRLRYTGDWYDADALVTYVLKRFPVFSSRERFIELILPEPKEPEQEEEQAEIVLEIKEQTPKETTPRRGARENCRLDLFYKGFAPVEMEFHGHHAGTAHTTFYEAEFAAFVSLVEQFQSEGITVVFLMAPEFLPGRDAPQFDEYTDLLENLAAQKNIPFLNYNRELVSDINGNYEYYSDWGHLNNTGAHVFSDKLYDDLNKILNFE